MSFLRSHLLNKLYNSKVSSRQKHLMFVVKTTQCICWHVCNLQLIDHKLVKTTNILTVMYIDKQTKKQTD